MLKESCNLLQFRLASGCDCCWGHPLFHSESPAWEVAWPRRPLAWAASGAGTRKECWTGAGTRRTPANPTTRRPPSGHPCERWLHCLEEREKGLNCTTRSGARRQQDTPPTMCDIYQLEFNFHILLGNDMKYLYISWTDCNQLTWTQSIHILIHVNLTNILPWCTVTTSYLLISTYPMSTYSLAQ